jgi:hypothetical protein
MPKYNPVLDDPYNPVTENALQTENENAGYHHVEV